MVKYKEIVILSLSICFLAPAAYGQDVESTVHFDGQLGLYFGYSSPGIEVFMLGVDINNLTRLYGSVQLSPLAFGIGSVGLVNQWLVGPVILEHSLLWLVKDSELLTTYNMGAGLRLFTDERRRDLTINITAGATVLEEGNWGQKPPYFDPIGWYVRATFQVYLW